MYRDKGLWKIAEYRSEIISLSEESLRNINNQPLFLRFLSLLIDDSNNMMGHGIETLQEIRKMEIKRQSDDGLTEDEEKDLAKKYQSARLRIHIIFQNGLFIYIFFLAKLIFIKILTQKKF